MNNEAKYESIINGIDEVIYEKIDVDSWYYFNRNIT